jgi:hypothetical protein
MKSVIFVCLLWLSMTADFQVLAQSPSHKKPVPRKTPKPVKVIPVKEKPVNNDRIWYRIYYSVYWTDQLHLAWVA